VDRVSPNRTAASSTLSSGFGDFKVGLLRMVVLRSSSVPGGAPWSQPILRIDVTLDVTLDSPKVRAER
jgi:hypothetical protein